jgi:hypothetical protein
MKIVICLRRKTKSDLHVSIDQPVELKIFVVVTKRIDELFGDLVDKEAKEIF